MFSGSEAKSEIRTARSTASSHHTNNSEFISTPARMVGCTSERYFLFLMLHHAIYTEGGNVGYVCADCAGGALAFVRLDYTVQNDGRWEMGR